MRLTAAIVTISLALLSTGCTGPASPSGVTPNDATPPGQPAIIGLSYIPNIQFAPFYVAVERNLLGGATLRHHGAQEGLFQAIAAGQEQFVVAGADEAMQAREQGVDLVAVAPYYRSYPVRIIARSDAGISSLADLRGKSVGVTGRFGESWFALLVALKSAGLTEKDVTVVEIGYTHQAALASKKVDAAVGFVNNELVLDRKAGLDVVDLALTPDGEPPLVGASVLTTRAFLDAHPDVVRTVARGVVAGVQATADDPAGAVEVSAATIPELDKVAARVTLDATIPIMVDASGKASGGLDVTRWRAMADFLLGVGVLTKPADVTGAVDATVLAG